MYWNVKKAPRRPVSLVALLKEFGSVLPLQIRPRIPQPSDTTYLPQPAFTVRTPTRIAAPNDSGLNTIFVQQVRGSQSRLELLTDNEKKKSLPAA